MTMLRARRASHDVFSNGSYEPLAADGSRRDHVFAFARVVGQRQALVVVPRLVATLKPDGDAPIGDMVWGDTRIRVPESAPRCYQQLFTGRCIPAVDDGGRTWIKAADVFEAFPIGFLEAA
jgi:(1->4)-alpha-D-glucan 1-alpha-D-glucosylmutase